MKDYLHRLAWGTDAGFYRMVPEEVLMPSDEADVCAIIARAHHEHKHITFRAAGTSLSGQAVSDSLLVVCGKKWEQHEILDMGLQIRLQPGIIGRRVNDLLRPYGRRFTPDPASINSAMVGGIVMNNASGMCCGTHANSYRMIRSVRLILADGTILDTGDEQSRQLFRRTHPDFLQRIEQLRDRTLANSRLTELIRKKYSIKNVTGLTILPMVEYTDPFDIITHLIPGSEGTLAFMSSCVFDTGIDYRHSASALLLYPTTQEACEAVTRMKHSGALSAAEYFDRKAMRVVEDDFPELRGQGEDAAAVLVKIEATTAEQLSERIDIAAKAGGFEPERFTSDPATVKKYWAMRSGIFPAVGATREIGTTCLIEDIAFPIDYLADATHDLCQLFLRHHYPDAVIYGHALEGNYHFILNQRFDTTQAVEQYDKMMHDVVALVVDKYHGSLKAEHGTGRNMAPFVRREWGDDAYQLMVDIKTLFDPDNIFNPGVIFNEDEQSYLQHLKPLPEVDELVDRCIECGFCEVNCVSCGFALSSRQRIVISREIARRHSVGDEAGARQLADAFRHEGKDLCAGDGLCSTSCPVGINVGELIHRLREQELTNTSRRIGEYATSHFSTVANALGSILGIASASHSLLGNTLMTAVTRGLYYGTARHFPLWTTAMPRPTKSRVLDTPPSPNAQTDTADTIVYFPSCINQRMGLAKDDPARQCLIDETVELLQKAGYRVVFPDNLKELCCGTTWESKGMPDLADRKSEELHKALRAASQDGKFPILIDQSPCLHRMRQWQERQARRCRDNGNDDTLYSLKLYEPAELIELYVLPRVDITPIDTCVALHPTCSTRRMGLTDCLRRVAQRCATKVVIPEQVGCCAFAGDKGFTHPELNKWALRHLKEEIQQAGATEGYSNSRTCEIGLTTHSGIQYMSIVYLVNKVSTPKHS